MGPTKNTHFVSDVLSAFSNGPSICYTTTCNNVCKHLQSLSTILNGISIAVWAPQFFDQCCAHGVAVSGPILPFVVNKFNYFVS